MEGPLKEESVIFQTVCLCCLVGGSEAGTRSLVHHWAQPPSSSSPAGGHVLGLWEGTGEPGEHSSNRDGTSKLVLSAGGTSWQLLKPGSGDRQNHVTAAPGRAFPVKKRLFHQQFQEFINLDLKKDPGNLPDLRSIRTSSLCSSD